MLQRGEPYRIKVLNTINFKKSMQIMPSKFVPVTKMS